VTVDTLPSSVEAERAVLGAVLVTQGEALDGVADRLSLEHFTHFGHQRIWTALLELHHAGTPTDLLTVTERLRSSKKLDEAGGPAYVAELVDGVPRSVNLPYYVQIVREKAARRSLIFMANRLLDSAYKADQEAAELIGEAERALLELSAKAVPGDLVPASVLASELYSALEQVSAGHGVTGLATGLAELDTLLRGLQPGNLIILGARPSQGKSTLAGQIAIHAARSVPVAMFSVEMSRQELGFRWIATLAEVDGYLLQTGHLPRHEQAKVGTALSEYGARALHVDDSGSLSALEIRSKARRMKAQHGLGLIVIDYLQLLKHERGESREQQVAHTGRTLKQIARELNVPVLALCQLNRGVESRADQKPKLSDLRESGSLEQDCDVALLLYRPQPKDDGGISVVSPTELIIAKSRNGPIGTVALRWLADQYRFVEVEHARAW
jgi:replicative DNA helicase